MQTIGDRLEEARKNKGVSLREAAESTKIRGEYLSAYESNSFDIDLPEIYIRGFLRNYANYLKLDAASILTDYDSLSSGEPSYTSQKKDVRSESYGRMDLGEGQSSFAEGTESGRPQPEGEEPRERRRDSAFSAFEVADKAVYLKVGAIVAGALVLVVVLFSVVLSVIRSDPDERPGTAAENEAGIHEFFLVARGDIDNVRVTEVETDELLWEGPLAVGDRISLQRRGQVDIVVSQAENLRIEEGGRGGNLDGTGRGRVLWGQ